MARRAALIIFVAALGFVANVVITDRLRSAEQRPPQESDASASQPRGGVPPVSGLPDLSAVAEKAIGSVPNISSTQVVRRPSYGDDPFLRFFFGDDLWRERREQSLGSGVVVSPDGYVLTNNHVVLGARRRSP